MSKRFVCYTVLIGGYDELSPIKFSSKDVDFICITDNKNLNVKGWEIQNINNLNLHKKNFISGYLSRISDNDKLISSHINRLIKFFPHKFFNEYEGSMYIDGRVIIKKDPLKLILKSLKKNVWLAPKHRKGGNSITEAKRCYWSGKIGFIEYLKYRVYMSEKKFLKIPLTENGLLIRSHNNKNVMLMADNWWGLYIQGPYRDQLHWQEAINMTNLKFEVIEFSFNDRNPYLTLGEHVKKSNIFFYIVRKLIII
jgi:hypothetical protein